MNLAAKTAALLWIDSAEGYPAATGKLRGSIADRLQNTKFDSESARTMCRMVRHPLSPEGPVCTPCPGPATLRLWCTSERMS